MLLHSPILYLSSADPSIGRLDIALLPDQVLMELLVEGMGLDKEKLKDNEGDFKEVCAWTGVQCTKERVSSIKFFCRPFTIAQFPFDFIPPLTWHFTMFDCSLRGTLDTAVLPQNLLEFSVSKNSLHGEINFKDFPRMLRRIYLFENNFTGSCVLSDLPPLLTVFDSGNNTFSGDLSLSNLPQEMQRLILFNNRFSGSINIQTLPPCMWEIDLEANQFTGDIRIAPIPESLGWINVRRNPLSGTVIMQCQIGEAYKR